ncbi:hypothetical protein MTE2_4883 [Klebsiella pneumoniae VA360]|nr:hypothetical protein MTE2_4883 [Klebsiella pneumoniae VA360]
MPTESFGQLIFMAIVFSDGVVAPRESDINFPLSIRFSVICDRGVEILQDVVR